MFKKCIEMQCLPGKMWNDWENIIKYPIASKFCGGKHVEI